MAAEPGRVFCIIQVIGSAHVCDSPGLMMMDQFGSYKFSKVTNQSSLARQSLPPWRNRREENPNWTHGGQQQREKRRKGHLTEGRQRGGRGEADFRIMRTYFFKSFIYLLFLERGKGREKERERKKQQCARDTWLPLICSQLQTWPTTQACALTGNWTGDLSIRRPALNPLSHTSQGEDGFFDTHFKRGSSGFPNQQNLFWPIPPFEKNRKTHSLKLSSRTGLPIKGI